MRSLASSVAWSVGRTVGLMWVVFGLAALVHPELAQDSTAPESVASLRTQAAFILTAGLTFLLPLSLLSRTPILWFATAWFSALLGLSLVALVRATGSELGLLERLGVYLFALLAFIGPPMGMLWLLHGWRLFRVSGTGAA